MDQAVAQDRELADRLTMALRQDEFVLYGQSIVPIVPDAGTRPIQEILIRFQEEETKLLPPGSFLPILEDCGLMHLLDRWVVSRITKWAHSARVINADWPVPLNSINLSAATLSDRQFAPYTRRHLQAARLPRWTVSFELTCDSAALNVDAVLRLMEQLRPDGCAFTLARFDGSYRTFQLLRRLSPDFVKLSPQLVRLLDQGMAGIVKVEAIVRECHSLKIRTIAEHVEKDETFTILRKVGVNYGQGFGLREPQPLG